MSEKKTSANAASTRGRRNRQRGAEGEREIVALVRRDFGIELRGRRLGQERDGGYDVDIGSLRAQVKRRRRLAGLYDWLEGVDIVCLRGDSHDWLVAMPWPLFARLAAKKGIPQPQMSKQHGLKSKHGDASEGELHEVD